MAITPNGAFAYVTAPGAPAVYVIDTATNSLTATIPATNPVGLAITPNGASAYVTEAFSGLVTVIDTATNTQTAAVTVPGPALQVAITPDGAFAYVTGNGLNQVYAIDTATNTLAATIPVEIYARGIAIVELPPSGPTNKDQCKNGGWQTFTNPTFKNQGQCIKYVNGL